MGPGRAPLAGRGAAVASAVVWPRGQREVQMAGQGSDLERAVGGGGWPCPVRLLGGMGQRCPP